VSRPCELSMAWPGASGALPESYRKDVLAAGWCPDFTARVFPTRDGSAKPFL